MGWRLLTSSALPLKLLMERNTMTDSKKSSKCPVTHLTTNAGAPVTTNRDSLTAGPRGPLLAQDTWLNEKLANFVREVIPERRMHAKGSGADRKSTRLNSSHVA